MSFNKCKNNCVKHNAYDYRKKINNGYEQGFVRCVECKCHFKKDLLIDIKYCPCCKNHLTYKSKYKKRREINARKKGAIIKVKPIIRY